MMADTTFPRRPHRASGAVTALHPLVKGSGFTVLFLLLVAMIVPDVLSLNLGSLRLPPIRLGAVLLFIPAMLMFLSRNGGRLYNFDVFFILFCIWTAMCIIINRGIAGGIELSGAFILEYLVIYLMIQGMIVRINQLENFIWLTIAIVVILGILAIIEAVSHNHFLMQMAYDIANLGKYNGAFFGSDGNNVRLGMLRATSIFNHPILYGLFCAAFFSYAWYMSKTFFSKLLWGGSVSIAAFFSLSAGPLLSLIVQFIAVFIEITTRKIPNRAPIVIGIIASFLLLVQVVSQSGVYRLIQFIAMDPGSTSYRKAIWQNGIDDVLRNPIFGFRPENWTRPGWMSPSVDNHWLLQMMVSGIPSVIFLAICLIILTRRLFKSPDAAIPPELARMRRAWAYSILGMVICGATVAFFEKAQPLFAILIGIGGSTFRLLDDWERAAPAAPEPGKAPKALARPSETSAMSPQRKARRTVL